MSETMRLSERNALIQAMLSNAERLKDFYRFTHFFSPCSFQIHSYILRYAVRSLGNI